MGPATPLPVLALLLAACNPQAGPGPVTAAPPVPGFACPPAGTVVAFDDGVRSRHLPPDAGDATICVTLRQDGSERRNHFGVIPPGQPWSADFRAGLAPLFPLAPGRRAEFTFRDFSGATGQQDTFREVWEVTGEERLRIGGQEVDSWVVRRVQSRASSPPFSGERIYWVEKRTNAWLRMRVGTIASTALSPPNWRSFEATSFQPGG